MIGLLLHVDVGNGTPGYIRRQTRRDEIPILICVGRSDEASVFCFWRFTLIGIIYVLQKHRFDQPRRGCSRNHVLTSSSRIASEDMD